MDIRNGKEIFKELFDRYNFSSIYFENGFSYGQENGNYFGEIHDATEFLIASAVTGNKVIGFFKNQPTIKLRNFLRGECILVTESVPQDISFPTIFIRKPEAIAKKLATALKLSQECKIPVVLCISDNSLNAYTVFEKPSTDLARTSAYIHPSVVCDTATEGVLQEKMKLAAELLNVEFPYSEKVVERLSFQNPEFDFFDYLVPRIVSKQIGGLKGATVCVPQVEDKILTSLLKNNYDITFQTQEPHEQEPIIHVKDFLCPGCPLVNIFIKSDNSKKIVFTNISCAGVFKAFPLFYASFDSYCGLHANALNVPTMFIGNVSSYKPYYNKFLKNGQVVFLNDCGMSNVSVCTSISHPKKFPKEKKNILYPYSCPNIKKYSKPKIKESRCSCLQKGDGCLCMESTKCPALYVVQDKVAIDSRICSGCYACKSVCKFGAVS